MNIYTCGDSQNHSIVAESMDEAVKVYRKYYNMEPKRLELFSEYVLIQESLAPSGERDHA